MKYRPEIDGLRAIAVLPVIFFHAGLYGFSGGFVGVDIFFVISGFLITSLILSEKDLSTFKLLDFYERRARRILPALFLVIFTCAPIAWAKFLPAELKAFSFSTLATVTFVSNIFFWRTSGYFEPASELKPLLHTWSLSVEEQYYLIFPLIITLLWKFKRNYILFTLIIICIGSMVFAQTYAISNPNFAFFALPTRIWELLIGAFVSFYLNQKKYYSSSILANQIGSIIGFSLIALSIYLFDSKTTYPSLYTLAPTIGAAMLIIFATPKTMIGMMLSSRLLSSIGLLSYSMYLWHQPLFAFARHSLEPSSALMFALMLAILSLSFLSWKYVETPFRNRRLISTTNLFIFCIVSSISLIAIAAYTISKNGDLGQVSNEKKEFLAYFENSSPNWQYSEKIDLSSKIRNECNFFNIEQYRLGKITYTPTDSIDTSCYKVSTYNSKAIFIWGDSHAQRLNWGLKETKPSDWALLQVASSGCSPMLVFIENRHHYCEYSNWFALKEIQKIKPRVVLISQNLDHNLSQMLEISKFLTDAGVGKVIFTGPTPHWRNYLPFIIASDLFKNTPARTFIGIDKSIILLDKNLKANFPISENVQYVSLIDYFCNEQGCLTHFGEDVKAGITSNDEGHLTPISSLYLAKDLLSDIAYK
jgi:peptidoglycan/LPS O-acetylase OafA/YrhL